MERQSYVFISYSHDSPEHAGRVLALGNRLIADGVNCKLDQYDPHPAEGWPRWMTQHLEEAAFVLSVCTEMYNRRCSDEKESGKGRGVKWESTLTYNYIYTNDSLNERFIPIIFEAGDRKHIPAPLRGVTYYNLGSKEGYEALYRRLTAQPLVVKPEPGEKKILPPRRPPDEHLGEKKELPPDSPVPPTTPWGYGLSSCVALFFLAGLLMFKPSGMDRAVIFALYLLLSASVSMLLFGFINSVAPQEVERAQGGGGGTRTRVMTRWAGPVVLFLVLMGIGLKWGAGPDSFDFVIFISDKDGQTVLADTWSLEMTLGIDVKSEKPDPRGRVTFRNIPSRFRDKEVLLRLDAEGWLFQSGKKVTTCLLKGKRPLEPLVLKKEEAVNDWYCCLQGIISDGDGERMLPGVIVSVGDVSVKTGSQGRFFIHLPGNTEQKMQLTAEKEGYETVLETVYPEPPPGTMVQFPMYRKEQQ